MAARNLNSKLFNRFGDCGFYLLLGWPANPIC
jgi:hypothetical protein